MVPSTCRRWVNLLVLTLLVGAAVFLGRSVIPLVGGWFENAPDAYELPPGFVDDMSRLNRTPVAEVWDIPTDPEAAENQLRALLQRARAERRRVALAGARHSMGGHTIAPEGIVVNMLPFKRMELDATTRHLRVGAGARWSEVLPYLDARGLSVAVMQSNSDFTIGGSLSVNCHGPLPAGSVMAATVESLRVMKPDGTVVRCSRTENEELFALVLGGYGLFGIILESELRVVPNECYRFEGAVVPYDRYRERWAAEVGPGGGAGLVYGHLCVDPAEAVFLREAMLLVFRSAADRGAPVSSLHEKTWTQHWADQYQEELAGCPGTAPSWDMTKRVLGRLAGRSVARNQVLQGEAPLFQGPVGTHTLILQEYFVPPEQFVTFVDRLRAVVRRHAAELISVLVRNVSEDRDTFLRYADQNLFSLALVFRQPRKPEADAAMQAMTRELIDAALDCGGRFFLPYRLHATGPQLEKAYPMVQTFFERKRLYDPGEILQNQFYLHYGRP